MLEPRLIIFLQYRIYFYRISYSIYSDIIFKYGLLRIIIMFTIYDKN